MESAEDLRMLQLHHPAKRTLVTDIQDTFDKLNYEKSSLSPISTYETKTRCSFISIKPSECSKKSVSNQGFASACLDGLPCPIIALCLHIPKAYIRIPIILAWYQFGNKFTILLQGINEFSVFNQTAQSLIMFYMDIPLQSDTVSFHRPVSRHRSVLLALPSCILWLAMHSMFTTVP